MRCKFLGTSIKNIKLKKILELEAWPYAVHNIIQKHWQSKPWNASFCTQILLQINEHNTSYCIKLRTGKLKCSKQDFFMLIYFQNFFISTSIYNFQTNHLFENIINTMERVKSWMKGGNVPFLFPHMRLVSSAKCNSWTIGCQKLQFPYNRRYLT